MNIVCCLLLWACDGNSVTGSPILSATATSASASAPVTSDSAAIDRRQAKRDKKPLPLVYIDGKAVGVMKYGELPASLKPKIVVRVKPRPIWPVAAYLEALGAPLDQIKAIHLVGGKRISAIEGDELRDKKNDLHFKFSRVTSGAATMDWPDMYVKATTRIDRVRALYVFVDKEAPTFHRKSLSFKWKDGSDIGEGVPHGDGKPLMRGPRIYIDDVLHTAIDSEALPEELVAKEGKRKKKYGLSAYLKHAGVPLDGVKAIDFIAQDERTVGRLDEDGLKKHLADMTFSVAAKGKAIRLKMPSDATPEPGKVDVKAVIIYVKVSPRERDVQAPKKRPGKRE